MPDVLNQISDYARQLDDETRPLSTFAPPRRVVARPWAVVAGAAGAVLLLIGVPLLINSLWFATPPAQESPVTTVAGFDYATGSLCDWFTAGDMRQIVTAAQEQAGTDWPLGDQAFGCWGYRWYSPSSPFVKSVRVDLRPIAWFGRDNDTDPMPPAEDFSGHEMLDESIAYGDLEYHCSWLEIVRFQLRVEGHEDEVLYFRLDRSDPASACIGEDDAYAARVVSLGFAVADAMLKDMGWIDQPSLQSDSG